MLLKQRNLDLLAQAAVSQTPTLGCNEKNRHLLQGTKQEQVGS